MDAKEIQRCGARMPHRGPGYWFPGKCRNKVVKDGRCGIHHPDAEARRRAKSQAKYDEYSRNIAASQARRQASESLIKAVLAHAKAFPSGLPDPETLAKWRKLAEKGA